MPLAKPLTALAQAIDSGRGPPRILTEAPRLGLFRAHGRFATERPLTARALPRVLLLIVAGAVSDRLPRRRTAIAADVVRGIAVAAIAALAGADSLRLWHLIVMAVVFGTADALFMPTITAIVPEVLPSELLIAGSGLNASSRHLGEALLGPALGGFLVGAVGTSWAFGLDAVSFDGLRGSGCCLRRSGRVGRRCGADGS